MSLGRLLTSGVDVWLNTPVHPLEASGTSGMKAAINGTVNLSVLDGWWAEACDGRRDSRNGWGIPPARDEQGDADRDRQDSTTLYEILQDEVVPLYYARDELLGYSPEWVRLCKRSMASVLPAFNSERVLHDYLRNFYVPAARQGRALAADEFQVARELGDWKDKVRAAWPGVTLKLIRTSATEISFTERVKLDVEVALNGLAPRDVRVECLGAARTRLGARRPVQGYAENRRPEARRRLSRRPCSAARAVHAGLGRRGRCLQLSARAPAAVGRHVAVRGAGGARSSAPVASVRARVDAQALSSRSPQPQPKLDVSAGSHQPLGATAQGNGVNFAVYSPRATRVWLRLYRGATDAEPLTEIELDAAAHRTFGFWHVFVAGARAGWFYTWRADGPDEPEAGLRFDARRELLDPWARLVSDAAWERAAAIDGGLDSALRAEIAAADEYDWEGDQPLRRPLQDAVIYELHVRGFTRHPSAGVASPGTFRGLIEKIPYLQALGMTDVELLPVFAYDRQDVPAATAALGLYNFWGYSPVSFFAPHGAYAAGGDPRREFRDLVKALHAAGIGVILDVVLNHTAEGGADGPTIGYKGLVNEIFYLLDPEDRSKYLDFTGCGNTVSSNQALVAQWLVEVLRFWAVEMHVDGFRFDLAGVLSRDEQGKPLAHAPVIAAIELAPELRGVHLIAEAWDAGGLYQVGSFPGFPLGRVERPLSRYRAALLARRARPPGRARDPYRRQQRSLCVGGQAAAERHQLRHLPRRLHAQ